MDEAKLNDFMGKLVNDMGGADAGGSIDWSKAGRGGGWAGSGTTRRSPPTTGRRR